MLLFEKLSEGTSQESYFITPF